MKKYFPKILSTIPSFFLCILALFTLGQNSATADPFGQRDHAAESDINCIVEGGVILKTYHNTGSSVSGQSVTCYGAVMMAETIRYHLINEQTADCTSIRQGAVYLIYFAEAEPMMNQCYPPGTDGLYSHQKGFSARCCWFGVCGNGIVESLSLIHI